MTSAFRIERISDIWDERLTSFRKKVCAENGAGYDYLDKWLTHKETKAYHDTLAPDAVFEEIWKFGNSKWQDTQFDNIEAIVSADHKVIHGISGCRLYSGGLLRVSMHLYILKGSRRQYRNLQFCENGIFSQHLDFAKNLPDLKALFMTVFPHNNKLKAHVKNLASRHLGSDGQKLLYVDRLQSYPAPILFNQVEQYFFFYPLQKDFEWSGAAPLPL